MAFAQDHWLIDCVFNHFAKKASFRLYGVKTIAGTLNQTNLNTFANTLFTTLQVSVLPCLAPDAEFVQVKIKAFEGSNEFEALSTGAPVSGTATGEMMPEENAVVIQRRTGKIGRSKRGRIFFPFIAEPDADDSELTTSAINKFKTLCTAIITPFVGGGMTVNPVTPDFKNGVLETVTQARVVGSIMSQRPRRDPRVPTVFAP